MLSAIFTTIGLVMPTFTLDTLGAEPKEYSVLSASFEALAGGEIGVGLIILFFSAIFPALKLAGLAWIVRTEHPGENRYILWLEWLGKWSMLDVFVVATLFGAARLKYLSDVEAHNGIYLFALGILLSLVITAVLAEKRRSSEIELLPRPVFHVAGVVLALIALLAFLPGIVLPVLEVEKWLFWENRYSLLSAIPAMMTEGEFLLSLSIMLFVIVLPFIRIVSLLLVQCRSAPGKGLVEFTYRVGRWAMLDVYVLAVLVVLMKLGDLAQFSLLPGSWLLGLAALCTLLSGQIFHQRLRIEY